MQKTTFEIQELESRFEMELVTLPNGEVVDVSAADMQAAAAGKCSCTSTCSPS